MADIFSRLCALRDCLCDQIKKDGLPAVAFCEIVPGEAAAGDYFNCTGASGMAWVRLTQSYRASQVGVANVQVGNCGKETGFDVEIGIMRCAALARANGLPPSPKSVREAAALQIMDMETMVRAVNCCPEIHSKDYVVGSYQPLGPEGGVVGGFITLSMI